MVLVIVMGQKIKIIEEINYLRSRKNFKKLNIDF